MPKISELNSTEDYQYGNLYCVESGENWSRLKIGPSGQHIKIIDKLCEKWDSQEYYILYVSLISHTGKKQGRYQSPLLSKEDLDVFLYTHQELLEGYGGQHLWIGNPKNNDLLIYDQHNIIYAYGDLHSFEELLNLNNYKESVFSIPFPHSHHYGNLFTKYEDELFEYFDWQYSELCEGDEY